MPLCAPGVPGFHPIGMRASAGKVWNKSFSYSIPGRLLAPPLNRAGWPGQLFSVEQHAAWALNFIDKIPAWAFQYGLER